MKNIIIGEFKHETNTFSPHLTDVDAFKGRNYLFGEEILVYFDGVKNEMGAFLDVFNNNEKFNLIPSAAFNAMPAGPVTMDVYNRFVDELIKTIRQISYVDGILLSLHGAMVLTGSEDGEGDLLEVIRAEVGSDIPIIVTLDLHVNLTHKMMQNANGFFVFESYPHIDMYEYGIKAAKAMENVLNGIWNLTMKHKKMDMIIPYMPTELPNMKKLLDLKHQFEEQQDVICVNICHGFFAADIYEEGAAVIVITNNNPELADDISNKLAKKIWDYRKILTRKFYTIDKAIDEALSTDKLAYVFADVADNPGAGSPCDGTHMLRRLIERKVKNVAVAIIYDPEVVNIAQNAGVGSYIDINLGGKTYPEIMGQPLSCKAYVRAITDGNYINKDVMSKGLRVKLGLTAILVIYDIEVIVTSNRTQPWDLEVYRSNGITPENKKILVVKSTVHYRASYGTIAYKIIDVELPGLSPQSPKMLNYKKCRRPIYPLDNI